jgi:hypothetical protein
MSESLDEARHRRDAWDRLVDVLELLDRDGIQVDDSHLEDHTDEHVFVTLDLDIDLDGFDTIQTVDESSRVLEKATPDDEAVDEDVQEDSVDEHEQDDVDEEPEPEDTQDSEDGRSPRDEPSTPKKRGAIVTHVTDDDVEKENNLNKNVWVELAAAATGTPRDELEDRKKRTLKLDVASARELEFDQETRGPLRSADVDALYQWVVYGDFDEDLTALEGEEPTRWWCGYCGQGPYQDELYVHAHHDRKEHPGNPAPKDFDPAEQADTGDGRDERVVDEDLERVEFSDWSAESSQNGTECQNCGAHLDPKFVKVFEPADEDAPRCCPNCETLVREADNTIRPSRSGRGTDGEVVTGE